MSLVAFRHTVLFLTMEIIALLFPLFSSAIGYGGVRNSDVCQNSVSGTRTILLRPGKPITEQIAKTNTTYVIEDKFDLRGRTLTMPVGCVLYFKGGSIRNGTITGNNTIVKSTGSGILFSNVNLKGTIQAEVGYPEWFGAVGDGYTDDRKAVQAAFDICATVILSGNYLIRNAPFDYSKYNPIPDNELDYYLDLLTQKNKTHNSELTPLALSSNKKVVISGKLKAFSPLGNLIELKGDNTVITGGGVIAGCGIVNTVNIYSGKTKYAVTNWDAALIYIKGSNNCVEQLTIKDPTNYGILIDDYLSNGNEICNNVIGGGLKSHTKDLKSCSFTVLFGIYAKGTGTIIRNNTFKRLDGKCLYDALYCNYTTKHVPAPGERIEIHTIFDNNIVEDALEHGVYAYASNLRITNNTIHSDLTSLQLFNGGQIVDNNILNCNEKSSGIYVSGENQVITNNKIYNVGRYGIRCAGYYNGSCNYDYVANNYIEKKMVPFSESQPKTTPAITFESTAFRKNRLHLNKITCENNTVVCKGKSASARTAPIIGLIAVHGDHNTTIDQIIISKNTITNSNVANNICITLNNKNVHGEALVEGNKCVNKCPIITTTPGDPVVRVKGVRLLKLHNNHLEQHGDSGTAFDLRDVEKAEVAGNTLVANLYARSVFYTTGKDVFLDIDGSNRINGHPAEQIVTIPANTTSATTVKFSLPQNRWDLEIIPINQAAQKANSGNPLKILRSDEFGVQLYHKKPTKKPTKYRIRVKYK